MILDKVKNSYIFYTDNQVIHTREYYNYCVLLLKKWLNEIDENLNVIFGDYFYDFGNSNKTIKVDIQCEHTLVKDGGRSVTNKIYGNVKSDEGYYLVRIDKFSYINSLDMIIEYSLPNIENIKISGEFDDYLSKVFYVAPMLYKPNFNGFKTDVITLFDHNGNPRRSNILNKLKEHGVDNKIVTECFSHECLLNTYDKTKIMVNVHQTDHHHTFEELRVLPALLNGVIIVSEDVPLKETIPYNEFIIWCSYDDIPKKTLEVINNYDYYFDKLFTNSNIEAILDNINNNNLEAFKTKI